MGFLYNFQRSQTEVFEYDKPYLTTRSLYGAVTDWRNNEVMDKRMRNNRNIKNIRFCILHGDVLHQDWYADLLEDLDVQEYYLKLSCSDISNPNEPYPGKSEFTDAELEAAAGAKEGAIRRLENGGMPDAAQDIRKKGIEEIYKKHRAKGD